MTTPPMTTIGSLCTGYGGLDLAAEAVTGGHTVWTAEIDGDCNRILDHRFPNAERFTDFTDPSFTPPPVDVLTAGFPCQPVSLAGNRKGTADDRWLWDDITALVGRMDPPPRLLLLENVAGLLTANDGHAMADVVYGLARLGYMGSWRLLRASDIGACHQRRRWFCVAVYAEHAGRDQPVADVDDSKDVTRKVGVVRTLPVTDSSRTSNQLPTPNAWLGRRPGNSNLDDPGSKRVGSEGKRSVELTDAIARLLPTPTSQAARHGSTPDLTANGHGYNLWDIPHYPDRFGDYAEAIQQHTQLVGRPAPEPATDRRLNPLFVEWMMGLPEGWVCDPTLELSRTAQLRILGNGVVPQQAIAAFQSLRLVP